jgi:hypothetical protein
MAVSPHCTHKHSVAGASHQSHLADLQASGAGQAGQGAMYASATQRSLDGGSGGGTNGSASMRKPLGVTLQAPPSEPNARASHVFATKLCAITGAGHVNVVIIGLGPLSGDCASGYCLAATYLFDVCAETTQHHVDVRSK